MTMKSVLDTIVAGTEFLNRKGVEDARLNMEHLLAHVLGCGRLDLYMQFDRPLEEEELAPCRALVKRRGEREPLQHLLGDVDFMGRAFLSDGRALIPRPETEVLVEWVVAAVGGSDFSRRACDVGCGSGVIGLSLAAELGDGWAVTLLDVSPEALELAAENAERLGLEEGKLDFFTGDLFSRSPAGAPFDLVVANLPYVASGDIPGLEPELRFDPVLALDGGEDGLELVRRLIDQIPELLAESGLLAMELGIGQAETVRALLEAKNFRELVVFDDYAGIARFVAGRRG